MEITPIYGTGADQPISEGAINLRREYLNVITDIDENTISVCLTLELSPYHDAEGAIAQVLAQVEVFRKAIDRAIPPRQPHAWRQQAYGESWQEGMPAPTKKKRKSPDSSGVQQVA